MTRGVKSQRLKGHLDLLVLAVLADGDKHGYAVIDELTTRSGESFELPEGTVYPVLHRLEKAGLLTSEWSQVQGRRRRTYGLTDDGRRALGEETRSWEDFVDAVGRVLRAGGVQWQTT